MACCIRDAGAAHAGVVAAVVNLGNVPSGGSESAAAGGAGPPRSTAARNDVFAFIDIELFEIVAVSLAQPRTPGVRLGASLLARAWLNSLVGNLG